MKDWIKKILREILHELYLEPKKIVSNRSPSEYDYQMGIGTEWTDREGNVYILQGKKAVWIKSDEKSKLSKEELDRSFKYGKFAINTIKYPPFGDKS